VLVHVLVIAPQSVLVVCSRPVLVVVLLLHLLWTVGDEVSWLAALNACLLFFLVFTRFSCNLLNLLVNNASSSSQARQTPHLEKTSRKTKSTS
jgi:hypothetical protein